MARPSKIDKLGMEAKRAIARWRDGGLTIDAIRALLEEEFGIAVSRSGLGRHLQDYDVMVSEIRASREAAALIAGELGEFSDERIGRFNQEMTESLIAKLFFANREEGGETIGPQALKLISEIQRNLAQAKRQGLEVEKGKARWRDEQRQKLAALEAAEAKGGKPDPARLLTRIRAEIYGL